MKVFGLVICCFALAGLAFVDAIVWDMVFGLGLSFEQKVGCWCGAISCAVLSGTLGIFWLDRPKSSSKRYQNDCCKLRRSN